MSNVLRVKPLIPHALPLGFSALHWPSIGAIQIYFRLNHLLMAKVQLCVLLM